MIGSSRQALWRSVAASTRTKGSPRSRARASLITSTPSPPAQGITQSNRWIGSAMTRAPMYSSSVSGFLNIACGMPSAFWRCATQILPKSSRVAPRVRMVCAVMKANIEFGPPEP